MQTYLFYDIETTGLNKCFDQVLQFAAIRTDTELNELKRYELAVKLNPDVIPTPTAVITHHIGIHDMQNGIPEYEAIKQIHQWLNEPGTISLGYNTLGFDDEFLRFAFYRNLLPPYTHQYANQCSRMDLYPMTIMFYLYKNDIILWPERLKLELINQANQLFAGRAHNAMVDVEVTIQLAKKLFIAKDMWQYLQKFFNKQEEQQYFHKEFNQDHFALMINGKYGMEKNFQTPVLFLGNHHHYKNQTVWLELENLDLKIVENTKAVFKKWGEPEFILPAKERFLKKFNPERLAKCQQNLQDLQQQKDFFTQVTDYHCNYKYPTYTNTDIEASLYLNGFWTPEEDAFCKAFARAPIAQKIALTEKTKLTNVKMLATRLLARNYPEALTNSLREIFTEYLVTSSYDFRGQKKLTAVEALQEITTLEQESLNAEQSKLLHDLKQYLLTI